MVDINFFRKAALAFADTTELPHFNNPSFRVNNRIFGTYWTKDNKAMLFLPPVEQSIFCSYDSDVFYPVPGSWGQKGATFVELSSVRKDMFKDALKLAYNFVLEKGGKRTVKTKAVSKVSNK